jgi:hypothetical protein
MSTENSHVLDIKEYHKQKLHETIKAFLEFDPCSFIEHQNSLLHYYLEHEKPDNVSEFVFHTTFQTQFLADLKTKWENYVKFNNVLI